MSAAVPQRSRRRALLVTLLVLGSLLAAGTALLARRVAEPDVVFLRPDRGATWLRAPQEKGPSTYGAEMFSAGFRVRFHVEEVPQPAIVSFRAYERAVVFLDGRPVGRSRAKRDKWKREYRIDLSERLSPGDHELFFSVTNVAGPPMLFARSEALGLRTDSSWEARDRGAEEWAPAATLDTPQVNVIAPRLERADRAFVGMLPVFLPLFAFVAGWTLLLKRPGVGDRLQRLTPSASGVRWLLLLGWAVLGANNITKVPYFVGFDVHGHLEYILYLIRLREVPFAPDGWVMFQSPLYHLLSAPLYVVVSQLSLEKTVESLRVLPLLCGALQVQLAYLSMRLVYPEREDLQVLGTVLGGLLPMNLYLSQNLGNETLVGLLCGIAVVASLDLLRHPERAWTSRRFALLGAVLGLALLTKVTALLLFGPIGLLIGYVAYQRRDALGGFVWPFSGAMSWVVGVALLVCGWYFARNWLELGAPFVGGWEKTRGLYVWWQEPGYRTFEQFFTFGRALTEPLYSAVYGLWDGLYSTLWLDGYMGSQTESVNFPRWNFGFMLSSVWLSLLPSAALGIGALSILAKPAESARDGRLFALVCLGTYLAAIMYLTLRVPSFSTVKATYTVGVIACYAIVGGAGFALLVRHPFSRAFVNGGMACWALAAYAAYFVI